MFFQADTVIYDIQKIERYQADGRFDYNSQLHLPEDSIFDLLSRWFNRLMNSIFSGKFEERYTTPVMIVIFFLILFAVVFFLYKKRPELFMHSKKSSKIPYSVEEENIHKIDFDNEISKSLANENYRLAIRLVYLQTLRHLSDNKLIDWQIHKTPTEYLFEIKDKEIKQPFRELTNHFLQVRYGNYPASLLLYETMRELQSSIKKAGGANER
jgi:hypothetical protein